MINFLKALLWTVIPILIVVSVIGLARMGGTKENYLLPYIAAFIPFIVAFIMGIILITVGKMSDLREGVFWATIPFSIVLLAIGAIIPIIPGVLQIIGLDFINHNRSFRLVHGLVYGLSYLAGFILAIMVVPAGLITASIFLSKGKDKLAKSIFWGTGINIVVVGLTYYAFLTRLYMGSP